MSVNPQGWLVMQIPACPAPRKHITVRHNKTICPCLLRNLTCWKRRRYRTGTKEPPVQPILALSQGPAVMAAAEGRTGGLVLGVPEWIFFAVAAWLEHSTLRDVLRGSDSHRSFRKPPLLSQGASFKSLSLRELSG